MKQTDLFGNIVDVVIEKPRKLSPYQQFKKDNNYCKGVSKFCRQCVNFRMYEYHNKIYRKCVLLGESHSEATDIRTSYVCDKFQSRVATA
jgi:uncharacterized protein (DUF983 family)